MRARCAGPAADLHRAGLEAAFSDLLARVEARGVETRLAIGADLGLPDEVEALFYRAAQEALRNVLAHADASHVDVRVTRNGREASLAVDDDGRGFAPQGAGSDGHLGLRLLADLAQEAGGRCELDSAPERGTRVRIVVPVT